MIEIETIDDVIAQDIWISTQADGSERSHEVIVGRPFLLPDHEKQVWVCPVSIQNFTDRIVPAQGVGPVDALMNAMTLVKTLFDTIHEDRIQQENAG
jgi:hypothetical protein